MEQPRTPPPQVGHVARAAVARVVGAQRVRRPTKERRLFRTVHCLPRHRPLGDADEPVREHLALAFEGDVAALFGDVATDLLQCLAALGADVDAQRFAVGLHARRRVHRVAKEAVARHGETDDARHDGT